MLGHLTRERGEKGEGGSALTRSRGGRRRRGTKAGAGAHHVLAEEHLPRALAAGTEAHREERGEHLPALALERGRVLGQRDGVQADERVENRRRLWLGLRERAPVLEGTEQVAELPGGDQGSTGRKSFS